MLRWSIFFTRNIYVYQWRSKGGGRSAQGIKINPLELESMIISHILLKSKNKAANSGCNSTKIFEKTRNATKYIVTLYMIHTERQYSIGKKC